MDMSRIRRRGLLASLALALMLLLVACGGGDAGSEGDAGDTTDAGEASGESEAATSELTDVEIGMVSHNAASPGIKLYADVFTAAAEERGWTVNYVDTAGDVVAAQNQINEWIAAGVDAIVVDTIPNEGLTDAIAQANEAGIPYFSVASGFVEGVTNEVTANEEESGRELTEALVEELGGEGRIVKLNWTGLEPLRQRDEAFKEVVAEHEGIEVVREVELKVPGWNEDAYTQVTNILQSDPEIDAIWLGWDDFAPDVVRAIEEAGLQDQIIVAGFDLDPAAADLLRQDGPFQMTNALPIPDEARATVENIETVLTGGTVEEIQYLDNCLATPETIPAEGGRESDEFWDNCKA